MNHFVPAKFTDRQWAEKLVQGEVFMRALHEFGLWGNVKEKDLAVDNDYVEISTLELPQPFCPRKTAISSKDFLTT